LLRHYLGWREKLLGGYLAIIAALTVAVWSSRESSYVGPALAILAMLLTVVFWRLEYRNRMLFQACVGAGASLEQSASLSGPFSAINEESSTPTHSYVLDFFFASAIVIQFVAAVLLWQRVIP
jgi:hypothetical protein